MPPDPRATARVRLAATGLLILTAVTRAGAQGTDPAPAAVTPVSSGIDSVVLVSGSGSAAGRAIARILQKPHVVLDGGGRPVNVPRGTRFDSSLVILSPRVTIGGRVSGDVVVVGGDLFTHPGGHITGDAIAVGGGVYQSALGRIDGGIDAFRDETFTIERSGNRAALAWSARRTEHGAEVLSWPMRVALRIPSYTRVDGVVLPWGPYVNLAGGRLRLDPTITYRSDLGNLEPGLHAAAELGSLRVSADARRSTFSNDRWIRSDLLNSITTLWAGSDTRNYFRADRIELRVGALLRPGTLVLEPYVGGRNELGWSTGGELSRESHPWSVFGRDSIDGIFRPNPPVAHIRIQSTLAGLGLRWNPEDVRLRLWAEYERAWDRNMEFPSASLAPADSRFGQLTVHGSVAFPTFAGQELRARAHAVTSTSGDKRPPPQRYAYLGGSGTLRTMELLEQGGTELFFFGTDYLIPLPVIQLPLVGSPVLSLLYRAGGAGVDNLPPLTQNIGAGLGVRFLSVRFLMDPETSEKDWSVGIGLGF